MASRYLTLAIMAFEKVERKKHQLERAEQELMSYLFNINDDELSTYVETTEEIRKKLGYKCKICQS
jgi:hypothetical protein